jgi:phage replication-related protein YjqB (UPF0714/DUF867 family)
MAAAAGSALMARNQHAAALAVGARLMVSTVVGQYLVVGSLLAAGGAKKVRARKMVRELRSLGYRVELLPAPSSSPA